MIEPLDGFPDDVVAIAATARVTAQDYTKVVAPRVEEVLKDHDKLRCYYEIGPAFAGMDPAAAWQDLKLGVGHLSRWRRVAVVTDVAWIRHAVAGFGFLMPGEARVFPTAEAAAARAWITEP